jgi:acyl-CoA synthetase (AMP-forming)/AMP-acid ligase II
MAASAPRLRLTAASILAPGVPAELRADYRRRGYLTDQTMSTLLDRAASQWPHRPAFIEGEREFDYRHLSDLVTRCAAWLTNAGVRGGDVVCWQTPNWWEAYVIGLATWQIGGVSNPVVPFYREHELQQIIEQARPAVVVTAASYRGFAHADAFDGLLADVGLEDTVKIVLRGSKTGWSSFDETISHRHTQLPVLTSAADPCLILFTSGTTSAPKGVVHSSQSLLAETRQLVDAWGLGWDDVAYMAAPLQHITGVLNAMTIPLLVGASAVVAERWLPDAAVREMIERRATYSAGATVFLQELTEAAREARVKLPLKNFACGGAAVPRSVMERSEEQGIPASRVYGMTELPTVTVMNRSHPLSLRAETDGAIAPGVDVRVVDGDQDQPLGAEGELLVRGPERMLGYLSAEANAAAIDSDGWFRTGDVGVVEESGSVSITGRLKDIINRGGEKFSARDIEDLLVTHPDVRSVAVVPRPDGRLGEVPIAFIVLGQRRSVSAEELASHVSAAGLAKQKMPVAWHFIAEMPMTPSGKIKKFELTASDSARRQ